MTTNQIPFDGVLNIPEALNRLGGDRQLFNDLAQFFQEDSPVLLEELRDAIAKLDRFRIQRAAHSLKGLAANFSAERAVAAFQALESQSATQSDSELRHMCATAEAEVGLVTQALSQQQLQEQQ